jgi:hypothetical protein
MIFVRSKHSQKFVGSCVVFTSAAVIIDTVFQVNSFVALYEANLLSAENACVREATSSLP